ncbi:uncharacterized protein RHOBADRAFT_54470 [Rhodotorula graminis WP1]|uniref:Uncharacterized protein n=1 Tax=Rhodotorula graminis (strain WP1) TaxID=578459 RepID=A0A0P9GKK6_RHOGW|nr:uncharacterized protein RHOBADRAFT_54470 [Rhodotorula graminis WP1]KPV73879.1 hypothetical protein RHOBADRAFT_54470 [Rhodotorula graminis WP1]
MPPPPMDPAIVSSQRPNAVYTRAQLLALHASPLVPAKLDGMKDLADWHGDFADPPSPPTQQRHGLPARTSDRADRAPARRLHNDASNSSPFANFGRFGVDGGLGEALESGSSRRRARGGLGAEREADKDVAPHLRGSTGGRAGGEPSSPTKERRGFDLGGERERGDRLKGRVAAGEGAARGYRELRTRDDVELAAGQSKRDARRGVGPADEGGWRNVGMSREEREKRLIRNQAPPSPHAPAEPGRRDRDRGERGDRERGDRDGPAGRSGRPAWMDDDSAASGSGSPGGSSPAWMDAPASGNLSFDGTGHVRDGEDKAAAARDKLAKSPLSPLSSFGSGAGKNGMDSLQAFKAQMKERERKDRERELRAAGLPIDDERPASSSATERPAHEAPAAKSIFEDLGIARSSQPLPGLGLEGNASASPAVAAEGGRGSRFARFFDGKPAGQASPQQQAAQQPPASAFSSLLGTAASASEGPSAPGGVGGGGGGGAGPTKEDSDSMARLLGMLQVSGARSSSPLVGKDASASPAPHPAVSPSPLPSQAPSTVASPAPTSTSGRTVEEGRASSRFNFSSKSTIASPATPAPPAPPGLQSPFLSAPAPPPGLGHASLQQQPAVSPAPSLSRSPQQPRPQGGRAPAVNGELPHQGHGPNGMSPQFAPQGPPMPPPGMPPQFYGQRFPPSMPGQLPPGMAPPHFGFAPDGRPLPPPPHPGMLPPFTSPPLARPNGPLSPPLASPNGISPNGGPGRPPFFPPGASLPPQMMFGPGGAMAPPPGGMPFPPPPPPPHHLQGRMPHPPPMFTGGTNPGADLMALLNSGSSGQRIGGDGPPQRPM